MKAKIVSTFGLMVALLILAAACDSEKTAKTDEPREIERELKEQKAKQEMLNSQLFSAIDKCDLELIAETVNNGAEVNALNKTGYTPLNVAMNAAENRYEMIDLLISLGADINARPVPLHIAHNKKDRKMFEYLISKGADMNLQDSKGMALIHRAAKTQDKAWLKELISLGADVNARDRAGNTPLHWIAASHYWKDKGVVDLMVKSGADLELKNKSCVTPLHGALENQEVELARKLIKKGADVNASAMCVERTEGMSDDEFHKLMEEDLRRIFQAHDIVVDPRFRLLLSLDVDIDTAHNLVSSEAHKALISRYAETPLHLALEAREEKLVDQILKKGADVKARRGNGDTVLHLAAEYSTRKRVEQLVKMGADVNAVNVEGVTILHNAATSGDKKIVEFLIDKGLDVNAKGPNNNRPLHSAVKSCCDERLDEVVKLLIERGAKVNARNSYRETPLHVALSRGEQAENLQVIEILVKNGADIHAKDQDRVSPLDITVKKDYRKISRILLEYKVKDKK